MRVKSNTFFTYASHFHIDLVYMYYTRKKVVIIIIIISFFYFNNSKVYNLFLNKNHFY
jgi:hypothetical protein